MHGLIIQSPFIILMFVFLSSFIVIFLSSFLIANRLFMFTSGLMAVKDPIAAAATRYKPVESAVPGTTLGPIQIEAFLGGGVCQIC